MVKFRWRSSLVAALSAAGEAMLVLGAQGVGQFCEHVTRSALKLVNSGLRAP